MDPNMNIDGVLNEARAGTSAGCQGCPWNPLTVGPMAFGTSCTEHTSLSSGRALVVSVAQDPGGTTPERTGRLCVVCNSRNASDRSAGHAFDLWRAAISFASNDRSYQDPIMRQTYFTNAVLHGVPTGDRRSEAERKRLTAQREKANSFCAGVLAQQLAALQPSIVMVSGATARAAVDLLSSGAWSAVSPSEPSQKRIRVSGVPHEIECFALVHASARGTNFEAAKRAREWFATTGDQERFVESRIASLPSGVQARLLLQKCRPSAGGTDTEYRGMMAHLAWWIAVGNAIRDDLGPSGLKRE